MLLVPGECAIFIATLAPLFTKRMWQHVQVLLVGTVLSCGKRTVAAALRVMGLAHAKSFRQYHRVLSRAVVSSLAGARLLLLLLVAILSPTGSLVMGLDDTLEQRRGVKIEAKGIYRQRVYSSERVVKSISDEPDDAPSSGSWRLGAWLHSSG